ncbi:hypothetical protein [Piscinibacter sp.]|uniref:hypothetical protein n=1 Tax=Piscinibacter sp. TaxID=1903157 RepID=UPI002B7DE7D3|nr:hypothetical protein [Albitalea sp.]HUG22334.1 hypothetical protein [Albitalea sp.]
MNTHLRDAARLLAITATLALTSACATEGAAKPTGETDPIRALIGDAACSSDAQCRTIGVGAKACGGPQSYLAWSTARTDEGALRAAAEQQASTRRDDMARSGIVSTCSIVPDPGAICSAGVCRLRATPGGGGAVAR